MDAVTVINTAAALMSLVLGGFAIWLSLHLYTKAKDTETETVRTLESIRAQSEALQRLTGRWMDRFTRHATSPKPADEGLLTLVSAVANLPTMILTHLRVQPEPVATQSNDVLVEDLLSCYICLYHYAALSNVLAQALLPTNGSIDEKDEDEVAIRDVVDSSAGDFQYMATVLNKVERDRLTASSYSRLLNNTIEHLASQVRSSAHALEARRAGIE